MWPFVRHARLAPIERLHDRVAKLARDPIFFVRCGVADSFEGRFELLALHVSLVLRRLGEMPKPAPEMAQELTDFAFRRLEQGLREIGIGDVGVPKRMKRLAKAFYGRAGAYHEALASGDHARLVEALRRNVLGGGEGDAEALARHVETLVARLAKLDLAGLVDADIDTTDVWTVRVEDAAMGAAR